MNRLRFIWNGVRVWFAYPWYPLVLSVYPVLFLLSSNVGQVKPEAGWRSLVVCLGLVATFLVLSRSILRDWYRAAFLSMLFVVLFFSYGHTYIELVGQFKDFNPKYWMLAGWVILFTLSIWWVTRPNIKFVSFTGTLNLISLGLVIWSLIHISPEPGPGSGHATRVAAQNAPLQNLMRPQNPPDIYYFILDMYTREDLLKNVYGYDNSGFVNALEKRGFYVAQCSQSNYTRTEVSIPSSLNFSYLQDLDPKFNNPESIARMHLWDTLKHSAVRFQLESMGYKTISFANGFPWSDLDDADVFLTPSPFSSGVSEFETLFMETTLFRTFQDFGWLDLDQISGQNFRDRDMLVFNSMKRVAKMQGPKFVYVHLILPHPPFVFGPDGEYTNPADFWNQQKLYPADKFKLGYTNQMTFMNRKMLQVVDTIISESKTPPIIILQGDHGPWIQPNPQHFFILNAYYLPGHETELYPTISPVNSFRLIFNDYFGGKYDMLKDKTYFSPVPKLYKFSEVSYPCSN